MITKNQHLMPIIPNHSSDTYYANEHNLLQPAESALLSHSCTLAFLSVYLSLLLLLLVYES